MELKSNCPTGPIADQWDNHRFDLKLVNPTNKRKYKIIIVGSGLAGAAAAASLAELRRRAAQECRRPRRQGLRWDLRLRC